MIRWMLMVLAAMPALTGCGAVGRTLAQAPAMVVCSAADLATDILRGPTTSGSRPSGHDAEGPSASSPGREPPPLPDDPDERIEDLYDACEYERCLELTEVVIDHPRASKKERRTAWVHRGAIRYIQGRPEEATACFRQARLLDRKYRMDRKRFKPTVVTCFEAAGP